MSPQRLTMKHLLSLFVVHALACLTALAQSPGDILYNTKNAGAGSTLRSLTPGTSTDLLSLNGSGLLTRTPQSTFAPASHTQAIDTITGLQTALDGKEAALTFGTGLTRTTNTITVNTTQNIAKLSNLTSNGFVKTTNSDGSLSVDTTSYLATSAIGSTVQAYSSTLAAVAADTWTGATSLTTLGTISTGTWQGTAIADNYIASAVAWNAKESALTFSTGLTRTTNTITVNTTQNIAKLSNLTSNGFVKTSGSDGTLSVDTTSYQTALTSGSTTNKFLTWGLSSWTPTSTSDVRDLIMPGAPSPVSSLYAWTWNGTAYGWSSLSSYLTANQTITLSGDITGSGTTAITTTIGDGKVTNAMLAGSIANSKLATDPLNASNLSSGTVPTARLGTGTANSTTYLRGDNTWAAVSSVSAANPTASIGLITVNGSAATFMRSDAAPALDVSIAPTWSGAHAFSRAGAVSAPTISVTGTAYTGGTATTTKPLVLIEPTGTTSTAWSTSGTYLGLNAASTFAGRIIDVQQSQGGSSLSYFNVDSTRTTNVFHCYVAGTFYWGNNGANSLGTLSGTSARMTMLGDQLDIVQSNPQTVNIWGGNTGSGKKLTLTHNGTNAVISTTSGSVSITSPLIIGSGGTALTKVLSTTTTWDPASLADGSSETKAAITLTGAAVGDLAVAALSTMTSASWDVRAAVTSANTVEVRITNRTGGAVDLSSGTLRITLFQH
jgi:hypothetical protein